MTLLIGALTIGLILSLLALGVFICFRIFEFPDITADGSITLGAALAAALLVHQRAIRSSPRRRRSWPGRSPARSPAIIHTRFGVNRLLSGILVMTALYSINLHIMGKSNVPLLSEHDAGDHAERSGAALIGSTTDLTIAGWSVAVRDASMLVWALVVVVAIAIVLFAFFRTNLGLAMQAAGDNAQMIRALGVNVDTMLVLGLALSNGLIALSGALLAQYQGFADVQMGIGMVVWGLASIIIGEALVGVRQLGLLIAGGILGSVLFRLLVAIALRGGLNPNDLKLVTAVFVFAALVLPQLARRAAGMAAETAGLMLTISGIAKMFDRGTPNEVRALAGVDPHHRGRVLRHRHRHERIGKVDAAERDRRHVPGRFGHHRAGRARHHRLAGASPGPARRPRVSESVQRHRAGHDDRGEPGARGAARTAARPRPGAEERDAPRAARARRRA